MKDSYKKFMYGFIFFLWFCLVVTQMLILVNVQLGTFLIIIISISLVFYLLAIFYGIINLSALKENFMMIVSLFCILILSFYCLHLYDRHITLQTQMNAKFGQVIVDFYDANSALSLVNDIKKDVSAAYPELEFQIRKGYFSRVDDFELEWYSTDMQKDSKELRLFEFYTFPKYKSRASSVFNRAVKRRKTQTTVPTVETKDEQPLLKLDTPVDKKSGLSF